MLKPGFLLFLLLLSSCVSGEQPKENPVAGKVFEFEDIYPYEEYKDFPFILSDIAFIDDYYFLASGSDVLSPTFYRGEYSIQDSVLILQFEQMAYSSYIPEEPATSAVDTNEYHPIVSGIKMTIPKRKFILSKNGSTFTSDNQKWKAVARKSLQFQLSDYLNGLLVYELDHLRDMRTLGKSGTE